mgnify:CR=1 FL=1
MVGLVVGIERKAFYIDVPPYSPSKEIVGLPTHKLLLQSSKLDPTETFCKKVAELVVGTNMDQLHSTGTDMLSKPVILYCIVF